MNMKHNNTQSISSELSEFDGNASVTIETDSETEDSVKVGYSYVKSSYYHHDENSSFNIDSDSDNDIDRDNSGNVNIYEFHDNDNYNSNNHNIIINKDDDLSISERGNENAIYSTIVPYTGISRSSRCEPINDPDDIRDYNYEDNEDNEDSDDYFSLSNENENETSSHIDFHHQEQKAFPSTTISCFKDDQKGLNSDSRTSDLSISVINMSNAELHYNISSIHPSPPVTSHKGKLTPN